MISLPAEKTGQPDRRQVFGAVLLFVVFIHLLPCLYLSFGVGTAPAVLLFIYGLGPLFMPGLEGLAFKTMLALFPMLIQCGVYYVIVHKISHHISTIRPTALHGATILIIILGCVVLVSLLPVYRLLGSMKPGFINFLQLKEHLDRPWLPWAVPEALFGSYVIALMLLLMFLFIAQYHTLRMAWPRIGRRQWGFPAQATLVLGTLLTVLLIYSHRGNLVCRPFAETGWVKAQVCLGELYQQGTGGLEKDRSQARFWYERAAQQGDALAAMAAIPLADTRQQLDDLLVIAADRGIADAQFKLAKQIKQRGKTPSILQDSLVLLERAAQQGHPQALYTLGNYYEDSQGDAHYKHGVRRDRAKARELWEQAAENGSGDAMIKLADRYERGVEGFPYNPKRAQTLRDQIAQGYAQGGFGFDPNPDQAEAWRRSASSIAEEYRMAEQGDPEAQFELGMKILKSQDPGEGGREAGLVWLERAAAQNYSAAQYVLGEALLMGLYDVPVDQQRGKPWWDRAVDGKHVRTMERVARAHRNGSHGYVLDWRKSEALANELILAYRHGRHGVEVNPRRESHWQSELKYIQQGYDRLGSEYLPMEALRRDAGAGGAQAQFQLANQLMAAGPVSAKKEAIRWWNQAAKQGHPEAQFQLVSVYRRGTYAGKDLARAATLLQQAAEGNHLKAMSWLALVYEKGNYGFTRDFYKAKQWYERFIEANDRLYSEAKIPEDKTRFERSRLRIVTNAINYREEHKRKYDNASEVERRIMDIEDQYRKEYSAAVNANRRYGTYPSDKNKLKAENEKIKQVLKQNKDQLIEQAQKEAKH